jgi:hypothetical protein
LENSTMKHLIQTASLLALGSCATTSSSTTRAPAAEAEPQKMAITNVIPFDVAACGPRELPLRPLTAEVLTGAMLSLSPATQECFVEPANRDGAAFDLKAKMTVAETGVTVELSGTGASAAGKACLEATFKKLPLAALSAGAKPVSTEIPIGVGAQTVHLGDNAANDIAGKLRLSQLSMCDCYAKLGNQAPPMLRADIEVAAGGVAKVSFATATADELTACLSPKFAAIKQADVPARLGWPLLLKNSYASDVDPASPAALRFQQLDGMRAQRTSDVLIAAGQRVAAATAYDELAQKYKKKPSKPLLEELKAKCAVVAEGDDRQIAAVKGLVATLENSQALAQAEKVKDAQWAQVEPQLKAQLTTSSAEVARIEEQKKNDLAACPKTKF